MIKKYLAFIFLKVNHRSTLHCKIIAVCSWPTLYVKGYQVNPFPNKPWFLRVCRTSLLKTLWEKKKLLVTSNFSFSHSVFYLLRELSAIFIEFEIVVCKLLQFEGVQNVSFGKGLKAEIIILADSRKYAHVHKFWVIGLFIVAITCLYGQTHSKVTIIYVTGNSARCRTKVSLTHCHTMTPFDAPGKHSF